MRREGSIKVSHCYDKILEQKPRKALFWLTVQDTVHHGGKTHANSSVLDPCLGNGHSHSEEGPSHIGQTREFFREITRHPVPGNSRFRQGDVNPSTEGKQQGIEGALKRAGEGECEQGSS